MKGKVITTIRTAVACAILAALFTFTLLYSLRDGNGIATAIITALLATAALPLLIGLLLLLWWRLFTPSGRRAEEQAQARSAINKIERKRDREWRRLH